MRFMTSGCVILTATLWTGCARVHIGAADRSRASDNSNAGEVAIQHALRDVINDRVEDRQPTYVTTDEEGARLWKLTRSFYERRQYDAAWIEGRETSPQVDALVTAIRSAGDEGRDPELYSAALVEQRTTAAKTFLSGRNFDPKQAAALDVWLTYLEMKFASDQADGLSDLAHADSTWKITAEPFDPLAHLELALEDNSLADSLQKLSPADTEYRALGAALADHRALHAKGGWPSVPTAIKIKPGQVSPYLGAVAARLAASGDYSGALPAGDAPSEYSAELQEAVKRFQRRHGLADDGAVGAAVVAEMNVPIEERIRQIELNMERWRWLPRELGERHILVNIAEMKLDVRDNGQVPLTMRVVVGKKDTQTPIFSDEMTHLVFSPYWNVPPDIARKETLPSVMKDPGFLNRMNMEAVDASGNPVDPSSIALGSAGKYRFRQRPGASNSLGLVKFMFPNQYNVYLHDTPADALFARASRAFSHGCVRLEQPEKLAQYVLRDQPDWTEDRIDAAMRAGTERTVKLTEKLPVYLGYWTARVSADGIMQFRKDVYGIDSRQTVKLADRLQRLRTSAAAASTAFNVAPAAGQSAAR